MRVTIRDIEVHTIIGVYDWEKQQTRPLTIHLDIDYDARQAAITDALEDALDYDVICKKVIEYASNCHVQLVETLASGLLDQMMEDARVERVRITVEKPKANQWSSKVVVIDERLKS